MHLLRALNINVEKVYKINAKPMIIKKKRVTAKAYNEDDAINNKAACITTKVKVIGIFARLIKITFFAKCLSV